jgi:hypothetical protein
MKMDNENCKPKYLGIVNNEQTSDGSGFVVITRGQDELEDAVQDILCECIKHDLKWELDSQGKQPDEIDCSRLPAFIRKHTKKLRESERFNSAPAHLRNLFEKFKAHESYFLEAEEDDYLAEFGLSIEGGEGFLYNVEVYDIQQLPQSLKSQLGSLDPNKFIYLYEMDCELENGLKKEGGISF